MKKIFSKSDSRTKSSNKKFKDGNKAKSRNKSRSNISENLFLARNNEKILEMHNSFKLKIELVPKPSWGNNVRNKISKKSWDDIREKVFKIANYSC